MTSPRVQSRQLTLPTPRNSGRSARLIPLPLVQALEVDVERPERLLEVEILILFFRHNADVAAGRHLPEEDRNDAEAIKGAIEGVISDIAFDLQQGTSTSGSPL